MEEGGGRQKLPTLPEALTVESAVLTVPKVLKAFRRRAGSVESPTSDADRQDGILDMQGYGDLPLEAFEIDEDTQRSPASEAFGDTFTYQRSAKRSIMLGLGIAPGMPSTSAQGPDPLAPYSKMDDRSCILTYMSVIVGAGTFSLSTAVAKIGWVQGFLALAGISVWNYLVAHLVTCLPQMLECNFRTYTDIAKVCLGSRFATPFLVLSGLCWWSACVFNLFTFQVHLEAVADCLRSERLPLSLGLKVLCVLPSMGFIWKTRGNELVTVSRISVKAMIAVATIEISCALCHWSYKVFSDKPVRVVAWRTAHTPEEAEQVGLVSALSGIIFAYAGVGVWPYVIADMLHPQNAMKVVKKASVQIGVFYTCVGTICYLGWGEDLLHSTPIQKMLDLDMPYPLLASLISILFSVKAVCAYPLLFRPLLREIETAIASDELPCVELRLPWALKWQQRAKLAVRVMLALSTLAILAVRSAEGTGGWDTFKQACACIFITVQIFFPAVFIVRSLFIHKRNLSRRAACGDAAPRRTAFAERPGAAGSGRGLAYLGGSMRTHFIVSGIVAAISLYISVMLFWTSFWNFLDRGSQDAAAASEARGAKKGRAVCSAFDWPSNATTALLGLTS